MKIRREHSLGSEEARRRVDKIAADLGSRLNLSSEWHGDALQVTGSGVDGTIAVSEDAVEVLIRTSVTIEIEGVETPALVAEILGLFIVA